MKPPLNYTAIIDTPYGLMGMVIVQEKIIKAHLIPADEAARLQPFNEKSAVAKAFQAYFNKGTPIHFPHELKGTAFQRNVWQALQKIPAGKVKTYGELAKALRTGPRAIGQACRTNPLLILVPCHRVVAAKHLGGFSGTVSGPWINIKKQLLACEGYEE